MDLPAQHHGGNVGAGEGIGYRAQLDALRGLAVAAVLVAHLYPKLLRTVPWLPNGWEGVRLFYVISGFLITSILLNCKNQNFEGRIGERLLLRQFYVRRFLRIFPVYYLVVVVTFLLNFGDMRQDFLWNVFYLSNWLFAVQGHFGAYDAHLWSLAVEEQYYLIWPVLVLFLPNKRLPWVFAVFILCGPLSRGLLLAAGCNDVTSQVVTTSNLDTLGMGGLLAYFNSQSATASYRFRLLSLLVGAPVYLSSRFLGAPNFGQFDLAFAGLMIVLVHHAAVGIRGPARILLDLPPLKYLGKISYGVYLFHNFSEPAVAAVFRRVQLSMPSDPEIRFFVLAAATTLAATVSWYCFEKPLNNLKRFFPYVPHARTKAIALVRR